MAFEACVFLPASQQGLAELCGKQDLGGRFRGSANAMGFGQWQQQQQQQQQQHQQQQRVDYQSGS